MAQPSSMPVPASAEVRPSLSLSTPEIGRPKKAGLQRTAVRGGGSGRGTSTPDGGYALTLAERYVEQNHPHGFGSHHDVVAVLAALTSARAGRFGRAPSAPDLTVAARLLGLGQSAPRYREYCSTLVAGAGHSYFILRQVVDQIGDAVAIDPANAIPLADH